MQNDIKDQIFAVMDRAFFNQQAVNQILACNENLKKYGLILKEQQALAFVQTHSMALKENQRIAFASGMIEQLLLAFCDSPYLSNDNFEDTMHELIHLFYEIKNNTWDMIADQDVIMFMRTAFDDVCHGSLELLYAQAMRLSEHIHLGGSIETWKRNGE